MKAVFALTVALALPGFAQNKAAEPDPIQTLLLEVRLLRQDIEAVTIASQRVQIALYSLQLQDAAVAREAQRVDAAKAKCFATTDARKHTASRISEVEGVLATLNAAAPEVKDMKGELASLQRRASDQDSEGQACQSEEAASVNQYQKEKAQLTELRDRIDLLDKSLERFTPAAKQN